MSTYQTKEPEQYYDTVVAEYIADYSNRNPDYQSEAALEDELIKTLVRQGYEYLPITTEKDLLQNVRTQLSRVNDYQFSDTEWETFSKTYLINPNSGIVEKTEIIQENHILNLTRDDGTTKNITVINKKDVSRNIVQVINQYKENAGHHKTRYDVTLLINGLPLVHIELKRRGVPLKEAFNQINRYQHESFWAGSGLFQFIQIFVISNGTHTKYYSNTTRDNHIKENSPGAKKSVRKTSNSFEFTSYWADAANKAITDLVDFAQTFLTKQTLLSVLTRYCVFTAERLLLVMRPYQIAATERILKKIQLSSAYDTAGTLDAGGYIWHTTGSGKTLTSFKTAQLAVNLPDIEKVLFIVDRKDLDYQTILEYDKFEKGAANSNKSTAVLKKQLEDSSAKIIVTTIQKLDVFISKNKDHEIYHKHVVLIFDECHRSQFGKMHSAITGHFTNYHLFGFTGTPIFAANAGSGKNFRLKTTQQAFGEKLHTYTIVNAIHDGNVLPFRVDYINTIRRKDGTKDSQVEGINTDEALNHPERISKNVTYLLEHFDQKTKRNSTYSLKGKRQNGFNSIFATASIPVCKQYYCEIRKQIRAENKDLKIAAIFSYAPNGDEYSDGFLSEESFETQGLDLTSREFLDLVIKDYNSTFQTNFDADSGFEEYYKDVSDRMKKRELDMLIVVDMFLTGFDATTLNTLWLDKNLRMHGLIQAYSRTNRILNSVKTFGNIICFRDLSKETEDAIALFGDKDAAGDVLLKPFGDYYSAYTQKIAELVTEFPLGLEIIGEQKEKDFIILFGNILRLRNILTTFDEFAGHELITPLDLQDYTGIYNDLHEKYRKLSREKVSILDDIIFETELVKQVEVNIDYVLNLVAQFHNSNCQDKEIRESIDKAIKASIELRSKKELIEQFLERVNTENYDASDIGADWKVFVLEQKEKDIVSLIEEEKLKPEETRKFVDNALKYGTLKTTGTDIDKILPPVSRFGGGRDKKKQTVIDKLRTFFERYFGLVNTAESLS